MVTQQSATLPWSSSGSHPTLLQPMRFCIQQLVPSSCRELKRCWDVLGRTGVLVVFIYYYPSVKIEKEHANGKSLALCIF